MLHLNLAKAPLKLVREVDESVEDTTTASRVTGSPITTGTELEPEKPLPDQNGLQTEVQHHGPIVKTAPVVVIATSRKSGDDELAII